MAPHDPKILRHDPPLSEKARRLLAAHDNEVSRRNAG